MRPNSRIVWAVTPPLIRGIARVAWRLQVEGRDNLPDPPYVLAANHHSFLDPLLLGAVVRRPIRFIGLSDLWGHHRWVDFFLDGWQVIPVTRGRVPLGPMRESLQHLRHGGAVGIFPEGTRHDRFDPGNARPGAAWLAGRSGAPLVPAAVRGSNVVLGVDNRLRRGEIEVVIGPAIHPAGTNRRAVAELTGRWATWVEGTLR